MYIFTVNSIKHLSALTPHSPHQLMVGRSELLAIRQLLQQRLPQIISACCRVPIKLVTTLRCRY